MHEIARQNQPTPRLCANSQCGQFFSNQFSNNMGLCQSCFHPFWSPRHDPGNQKLAAKLAGQYHSQLTAGCSRDYCSNKVSIFIVIIVINALVLKKVLRYKYEQRALPIIIRCHFCCCSHCISDKNVILVQALITIISSLCIRCSICEKEKKSRRYGGPGI
jgi:hypothetical protein